ncbi:MAG: GAF domain-containing protein [Caldilineaceae bacterium]
MHPFAKSPFIDRAGSHSRRDLDLPAHESAGHRQITYQPDYSHSSPSTSTQAVEYLVGQAGLLLDAAACAAYRLVHNINALVLESGWDLPASFYTYRLIPLDCTSGARLALTGGQPIVLPSLLRDHSEIDPTMQSCKQSLLESGCCTTLVAPLIAGDRAWGVLFLYYLDDYWFTDDDLSLAMAFGRKVAYAMANEKPGRSETQA